MRTCNSITAARCCKKSCRGARPRHSACSRTTACISAARRAGPAASRLRNRRARQAAWMSLAASIHACRCARAPPTLAKHQLLRLVLWDCCWVEKPIHCRDAGAISSSAKAPTDVNNAPSSLQPHCDYKACTDQTDWPQRLAINSLRRVPARRVRERRQCRWTVWAARSSHDTSSSRAQRNATYLPGYHCV